MAEKESKVPKIREEKAIEATSIFRQAENLERETDMIIQSNLYGKLYDFNRFIIWHDMEEREIDNKDMNYMISSINSYYGYLRQAKSYKLRKQIAHSELIKPLLGYAHFDKDYTKLIKREYAKAS